MKVVSAIFLVLVCAQAVAFAEKDLLIPYDLPLVRPGYHKKIAPVGRKEIVEIDGALSKVFSRFPKDRELTVGNVLEHIIHRLREEKVPIEVVFETNLHPLRARREFLETVVKKQYYFDSDLPEPKMREKVEKANCEGLLGIVVASSGLTVLFRGNTIILSNYLAG